MNHPIVSKRTNLIIYSALSIIVGIVQYILLHYFFKLDDTTASIDSIIYGILFSFIGLAIWFMVYYNDIEKNNIFVFSISHIISATIAVTLWIFKSRFLVSLFIPDNALYNSFLEKFQYLRVVQGYLGYLIIVLFYYVLIFYQTTIDNREREESFKSLLRDAELKSLKSQINPHFLFNSLNSISSLTMFDPEKAQTMIIKLSEYLRFSLQFKPDDKITFEKEIENIQRYLEIEKIRFGKRLAMHFDISADCNTVKVPTMILQPLFENAIKYGVHENTEETLINIKATKDEKHIEFSISNNYDPESVGMRGQGIGLSNIKERMHLIYGSSELVQIQDKNNIFTITLFFPDTNVSSITQNV
jgi:two-component system, LytTR family, sensor kinase